jgi:undecaprenyl-diphosphatase
VHDFFQAVVLGIIEGITEFLPISSTGHLLIAEHWLGARSELFNVAIQSGAILAVALIFWPRLCQLATGLAEPAQRDYFAKLLLAFAITVVGGLAAKQLGATLPETIGPVAGALIVGGLLILLIEWLVSGRAVNTEVTWSVACWVGCAQILAAVFPGTSRSAATIFAAMLTMLAATGYEFLKLRRATSDGEDWVILAVAFAVSGLVAFATVKWLLRYIQTHRFTVFAWYRIAAGIALLALTT